MCELKLLAMFSITADFSALTYSRNAQLMLHRNSDAKLRRCVLKCLVIDINLSQWRLLTSSWESVKTFHSENVLFVLALFKPRLGRAVTAWTSSVFRWTQPGVSTFDFKVKTQVPSLVDTSHLTLLRHICVINYCTICEFANGNRIFVDKVLGEWVKYFSGCDVHIGFIWTWRTSSQCQILIYHNCTVSTVYFNASLLVSETVSSEISDFTPCTHAQSNILHIKYADTTDY